MRRISHHVSVWQYAQVSGLKYKQIQVAQSPHVGTSFGRGEGWGLDAAVAAYATSSPEWRTDKRSWLDAIAKDREPECSGQNGAWAVEMVCAVYQSALKKAQVPFPLATRTHPLG